MNENLVRDHSPPAVKVTADAARRFLVAHHLLAPARSLDGGPDAVLEVFRRLGSVQFDPLAVAGRNHDLVLHARVADYDPAWCELLYERRKIFEAYNKGLSLVPTSEFAWFRGNLSRSAPKTLDENADFRHPEHAEFADSSAEDPLEAAAKAKGLNYVKLDGSVGIIGNGAGLVMSTLDVVAYAGEEFGGVKPANFLDIGGGASAEVMAAGLDVILGDTQVKSVFVNVFGGITACDAVANGIVKALQILGDEANKPLVVRLDGNNVEEGRRILAEANHPLVTEVGTMDEAADVAATKAAEAAKA